MQKLIQKLQNELCIYKIRTKILSTENPPRPAAPPFSRQGRSVCFSVYGFFIVFAYSQLFAIFHRILRLRHCFLLCFGQVAGDLGGVERNVKCKRNWLEADFHDFVSSHFFAIFHTILHLHIDSCFVLK